MNLFIFLTILVLAGCNNTSNSFIPVPRYLTKSTIRINSGEIKVKTNKKENIAPELIRMLGMSPMKFIEEWIDNKMDATGSFGIAQIEFPKLEILEQNSDQYIGILHILVLLKEDGKTKHKINVMVNASKGFDSNITYLKRKQIIYDLIQELIASAHDSIVFELKKIQ